MRKYILFIDGELVAERTETKPLLGMLDEMLSAEGFDHTVVMVSVEIETEVEVKAVVVK